MRHLRHLLPILLLLAITACASSGTKSPDWVTGKSAQYPAQTYLTGRGQGDNRGVAQDRARADLSKTFEVQIKEQSTDRVKYQGTSTEEGMQSQLDATASREVMTRTDQVIQGIEIAELWEDPETGQVHAFAILDRNKSSNDLRQSIQQQDSATAREIALAKQQADLFSKIGNASRAVELQEIRYEDQWILKIVDPTGIGVPPAYNLSSLRTDRDSLLQRLRIKSSVVNDPIGGLSEIVDGAIAKSGFSHVTDGNPDYLLESDLQVDSFRDKKGWFWYRGNLQVNLVNISDNHSLGSHRWEIKVSSTNSDTAAQRVLDTTNKKLEAELRNVIIGFGTPR